MIHPHDGQPADGAGKQFSWLRIRVIILCFLLNVLDGADVLVVSYAAPDISADWNLSPQTLGVLFSAGLLGMTAGALFIAPLADRLGRKFMVIVALVIIGPGMIASSFAPNIEVLAATRVLVGLGIGSMLATITALAAEFSPPRFRNLAVTISAAGYPLGAVGAGAVAAHVIPLFGWEALFALTGFVSLAMVFICLIGLPESPGFLSTSRAVGALAKLNRIRTAMGMVPLDRLPPRDQENSGGSIRQILSKDHRRATIFVWLAFISAFATLYFLTSWIPKLAVDAGLTLDRAIYAGASFNLGAAAGVVALGWLATTRDLSRVVCWFFVLAFVAMLGMSIGMLSGGATTMLVMLFVIGFFVQGGFGGLYAVAATIYPVAIRSTGVGWSIGAGRLGAVSGPMVGGAMIGAGASLSVSIATFAVPMIVAALAVLLGMRQAVSTESSRSGSCTT